VLEFLAALSSHIPQAKRKMTIYYGWYSQANRGKRKRNGIRCTKSITSHIEDDNRTLRYRWSQLIKKIYADPLICPDCGGRMKIIAFIKKKSVIEHILKHLGLLDEPSPCAQGLGELPHTHSPPSTEPSECDITYEPVYDDLSLPEQIELSQTKR